MENKVLWSSKHLIGLEELDSQHHTLARLINSLFYRESHRATFIGGGWREASPIHQSSAGADNLDDQVIDRLYRYAQLHFSFEESLMDIYGYFGLEAHRQAHGAMFEALQRQVERMRVNNRIYPSDFIFFSLWLEEHSSSNDREFATFVNAQRRQSRAPAPQRLLLPFVNLV
ncbi:MAG: hemerythrin family protein [Magnetococcales bacterium]|nr:hemerythrin family protein [Magnetococcales bacterium]